MTTALAELPTGADETEEKTLKLFEIEPDTTRPSTIRVNVNGSIDLDLSQEADVAFYNALQPGKLITRETTFFVASVKTTHRRDSEGNVDATPQAKSLVVDGVKITTD